MKQPSLYVARYLQAAARFIWHRCGRCWWCGWNCTCTGSMFLGRHWCSSCFDKVALPYYKTCNITYTGIWPKPQWQILHEERELARAIERIKQ